MMKKNGREKDRKGKERKEGHGKNNRIEIVPYSLLFFMISHLLPTIFHHSLLPPIHSYYPLSFFPILSYHLPSFSSPPPSLSLSLLLILSPHTLFLSHTISSLPSFFSHSFITPFFLSTLSHHLLLSFHPLSSPPPPLSPSLITPFFLPTLFHNPFLSLHPLSSPSPFFPPSLITPSTLSHHSPPFPPSHTTTSSLPILSHSLLLPSQPLSIRKLFSCCMALSGMVVCNGTCM